MNEKVALEKVLKTLSEEGYIVRFPEDFDHVDGINLDYEPSIPKAFLSDLRKAKKRGLDLSLIPAEMSYDEMMKEADNLESAMFEYTSADGTLKNEFSSLRDYKTFSRLPNADEKLLFFRSVHHSERAGEDLDCEDLAMLAYQNGADYVDDLTFVSSARLKAAGIKTKQSSKGCALFLLLLPAGLALVTVIRHAMIA